jgi:uroporphyrinogen-III decarboxylase
MNPMDRFLAVYDDEKRKNLDRVPSFVQDVKPDFFAINEEAMMDDYEGELTYSTKYDAPIVLGFDSVFSGIPGSCKTDNVEVTLDNGEKTTVGMGGQVSREGSSYYGGGALTSLENLEALSSTLKKVDSSKAIKANMEYCESIRDRIFPVTMIGGIFDRVWQAMGMKTFARHMRKRTKLYQGIVKYFAEISKMNVQGLIDATGGRSKIVNILDDIAFKGRSMIPPERFETDYVPYYKEITGMIRDAGMYAQLHTDGDVTEMIPILQKAGFQGLQGWEGGCDPFEIAEKFPDFVVVGFGDVSDVLPFGTEEEIYTHVKELMDALKENRHFVCGPSTVIVKEMPLQNVRWFMDAIKKYGKY